MPRRPRGPGLVADASSAALASAQHRWAAPPRQPPLQQREDHLSDTP
jgi:hypothetical protein